MQLAPNPTLTLADFTSATLMLPKLQGWSMSEVMRELSQALHQENGSMPDLFKPGLKALNRELLTSMALDFGAVLPQVPLPGLHRPFFALGRTAKPLPWRASFYPPIELVFLVVEPAKNDLQSRQLGEALAHLAKDRLRLGDLRRARNVETMLAVLEAVRIRTG